jgi:hypothetical protein
MAEVAQPGGADMPPGGQPAAGQALECRPDRAALRGVAQELRHVRQHGDGRNPARERGQDRPCTRRGAQQDGTGLFGEGRRDTLRRGARLEVA